MTYLVIGAGIAGLGAACALRAADEAFVLLEGSDAAGGLARTDFVDGFSFDRTGHGLHFTNPGVQEKFENMGITFERIRRQAAVIVDNHVVPYPIQYNLWALDSSVRQRAFEAAQSARAHMWSVPTTLASALRREWGDEMLDLFFRGYTEKLWGRRLEDLPADCSGRFLPQADLALIEAGTNGPTNYKGYNGTFLYPASGRLGEGVDVLAAPFADATRLRTVVETIDLKRHLVRAVDGTEFHYSRLISTIPLPHFLNASGIPPPLNGLLDATTIVNVRVGARGRMLTPLHWIYIPDRAVDFHRIGFPANVNARTCPPGTISLSIEYTLPESKVRKSAYVVAEDARRFLVARSIIEIEEFISISDIVLEPAYVICRSPGRKWFSELAETLRSFDVILAGRFGLWDYLSIEGAFVSGMRAANTLVISSAGAE